MIVIRTFLVNFFHYVQCVETVQLVKEYFFTNHY